MKPAFFITALALLGISGLTQAANWQAVPEAQRPALSDTRPGEYFRADEVLLRQTLSRAVETGQGDAQAVLELPVRSGRVERFNAVESSIMAPGLAAKFPGIKTYRIRGIDDPLASGRVTVTPRGINAMVHNRSGTWYLDPAGQELYRGYRKSNLDRTPFNCGVEGHNHATPLTTLASRHAGRIAGSIRVYRLAVAAAAEYVEEVDDGNDLNGDAANDALSEIVTTINRVNEVYQRDLGIKLELVDDNDEIVFATAVDDDPYDNSNIALMLDQNQDTLDDIIGSANYDVGHVFGTGGGGLATVGSVCGTFKAQGSTGLLDVSGEAFYIDYVAHELGHQFGAEHSYNGTSGFCGGAQRYGPGAVEPGSGSTIMAYAGICTGENLQSNSDAVFHTKSIEQINAFTASGAGATCGDLASITNNTNQPKVNAGSDFTIPTNTPFMLTAEASDDDGDTLSFTWDQMDAGTATTRFTHGDDLGDNALFRSYLPRERNLRYFPSLERILDGVDTARDQAEKGETLPTTNREMNFLVTVRDGKNGIGQDQVTITSRSTVGDFRVTSQVFDTTVSSAATSTVSWNVAGTTASPVSCAAVDISVLKLNTAKTSYCEEILVEQTSNDGSQTVDLPDETIPVARFKVSCSDNVFLAISRGDVEVLGTVDAEVDCFDVSPQLEEHASTNISLSGSDSGGSSGGGGALSPKWLLLLLMLGLAAACHQSVLQARD
jgi:hypothetical protein